MVCGCCCCWTTASGGVGCCVPTAALLPPLSLLRLLCLLLHLPRAARFSTSAGCVAPQPGPPLHAPPSPTPLTPLPLPRPAATPAGAPNVGGAWASEAYNQSWLVLESLRMATDVLAPKGTFVTKIFRWVLRSCCWVPCWARTTLLQMRRRVGLAGARLMDAWARPACGPGCRQLAPSATGSSRPHGL